MAELITILSGAEQTSVVDDSDTLNIIRAGSLYTAPASMFKGADGAAGVNGTNGIDGTNGTNGVGVPAGGTAGQVLSKNSTTDFDTHWVDPPSSNGIVDLTSASSDYALAVGETAYIDYTSATSVPLHVATVEGIYELSIIVVMLAAVPTNNSVALSPNNLTYSNAINSQHTDLTGTISTSDSSKIITAPELRSTFGLTFAGVIRSKSEVSTYTLGKSVISSALFKYDSGNYQHHLVAEYWNDTTTPWTSLGTITFPFAQSGKIIIKRVI